MASLQLNRHLGSESQAHHGRTPGNASAHMVAAADVSHRNKSPRFFSNKHRGALPRGSSPPRQTSFCVDRSDLFPPFCDRRIGRLRALRTASSSKAPGGRTCALRAASTAEGEAALGTRKSVKAGSRGLVILGVLLPGVLEGLLSMGLALGERGRDVCCPRSSWWSILTKAREVPIDTLSFSTSMTTNLQSKAVSANSA